MTKSNFFKVPFQSNEWYFQKINEAKLAKKSKSLYITLVKKVLRETHTDDLHSILVNPSKYVDFIVSDAIPLNTQDAILATMLSVMTHSSLKEKHPDMYDAWSFEFKKVNQEKQDNARSNIPSTKQSKCIVKWNDVLKIRDNLELGSDEHLLLSMYTYIPPRRQLDYARLRVYFDPDYEPVKDHNHFHVYSNKHKSAYIFINEYKTSKSYMDHFDTEIPNELVKAVIVSFQKRPRREMFVTSKGCPFTDANHFQIYSNKLLKEIFGNMYISVTSLRHSFATFLKTLTNLSVNEHDKYARKMGHSLERSLEYVLFDEQHQKVKK